MRPAFLRPSFLRRFLAHDAGNFAMILGLCAIPLCGIVGLGVDLTRAYIARVRLQSAVDNAALAAAALQGQPDDTVQSITTNYFYSNYHSDFWAPPAAPTVTVTNGTVHVAANANVPNYFLELFGYDNFTVATSADAVGQAHGLEVVMVLDISTSMNDSISGGGSKIAALKSAAKDLVDILYGSSDTNNLLKIGLVPFTSSVRLDPATAVANGWIDTQGQSLYAQSNFSSGDYAYRIYTNASNVSPNQLVNTPWQGCVEARPNGLDETDTPPDSSDPNTLWVPFFYPDNPDNSLSILGIITHLHFNNDYLSDGLGGILGDILGGLLTHQDNSAKYKGQSVSTAVGLSAQGPGRMCVASSITPLTDDKTTIDNAIDALTPNGYTHVALGASWGWRVLSPGAPYTEAHAYSDYDWDKALIILTDGDNTMPTDSNSSSDDLNHSEYTAYGFAAQARMGAGINTADEMVTEQNASLTRTCNNIKAVTRPDGTPAIRVYTIALGNDIDANKPLLQACATTPSDYFDSPTKQNLSDAFTAIGQELNNIRLTR